MAISRPQTLTDADNHRKAVTALQRGQQHHHRAAEARVRRQQEVARRDLDRAIEAYTECIELDPKNLTAYAYRARAYEEKGDDTLAEADLDMVRKLELRQR